MSTWNYQRPQNLTAMIGCFKTTHTSDSKVSRTTATTCQSRRNYYHCYSTYTPKALYPRPTYPRTHSRSPKLPNTHATQNTQEDSSIIKRKNTIVCPPPITFVCDYHVHTQLSLNYPLSICIPIYININIIPSVR